MTQTIEARDPYTRAVYAEAYSAELARLRAATPYSYSWCADQAERHAARVAEEYNATGRRADLETAEARS